MTCQGGAETAWPGATSLSYRQISDGTSNTILIVENRGLEAPWMAPRDLEFSSMSLEWNSPRGISSKYSEPAVVTLDGSVHRLHKGIAPETLRALLTANGGEKVEKDSGHWTFLPDGRLRDVAEQ